MSRWVAPDGNTYWIVINTSGSVYATTDLSSLGSVLFTPSSSVITRVQNYGTVLRFATTNVDVPRIYQKIDRDFFFTAEDGTDHFDLDAAIPHVLSSHITGAITSSSDWFYGDTTGPVYDDLENTNVSLNYPGTADAHYVPTHDLSATTYFYRYSLVYDGGQETPLSASLGDTADDIDTTSVPKIIFTIDTGVSLANWNQRITSVNIYRSTNRDSGFTKIDSISAKADDPSVVKVTDLIDTGKIFTDSGEGLTSAIDGKYLYINGFKHTIATKETSSYGFLTTVPNAKLANLGGSDNCTGSEKTWMTGRKPDDWADPMPFPGVGTIPLDFNTNLMTGDGL